MRETSLVQPLIRAVVFDMDGVLIDAREWHFEALNRALNLFGFDINRDDHLDVYDGLPTSKKLEILSEKKGLPRTLHALVNQLKQEFTMDIVQLACHPTFNHEYALSRLRGDGLLLAVASNSIRSTVKTMMSKSALAQYLEFMLSNEDVRYAKPSPEIYQAAFEKLGVLPHEVLVLEDNDHGIEAARLSGAHVLVVKDPAEVNYWGIRERISVIEGSSEESGEW